MAKKEPKKRLTNPTDFVPDPNYVPADPEKAKLVLKLGMLITDRMDKKLFRTMNYQDPEYWMLDKIFTKEEIKFLLSFEKRRVWVSLEEMAKRNNMSLEDTKEMLDYLAWVGIIETGRENPEKVMEYNLPMFVPGSAEMMIANEELTIKHPEIATFFNLMTQIPLEPITKMIPEGGSGVGMHVIPVEKAIETENESISVEKISHWLDKYGDLISLGVCTCRRQQRMRGEGDGSIEGDFCIGLGDMAEFTVNTGRARYITKEEALEVVERAEKFGYVHQITNIHGEDKIIGLCNCAPGVCNAIRTSQLYNTPNLSRSAYRAKVNSKNCVACGKCVEICPVGAVKLGRKIACKYDNFEYPKTDLPSHNKWTEENWNADYRQTAKENCYEIGTSPCKTACPAHIAVQGYIKMAKEGRYMEALKLIKQDNPLPAVCGAICNRRCEEVCTRGKIDSPIAIDEIKKFISALELKEKTRYIPVCENAEGNTWEEFPIAVIGSGPAGISCAYYLREQGYPVTVFEKEKNAGGMLMNGIPNFRLEKDVLEAEIDVLKEMGVEFKHGVEVGKDITLDQLREEGFKAFFVAIGAQGGKKAGVDGENAKGVDSGVQFLKDVNLGNLKSIKGKTIVIGGGNVAIDVARTAVRLGADEVEIIYRRNKAEMPADPEEIREAEEEGVIFTNGWAPKEINAKNGKLESMTFSAFSDKRSAFVEGLKEGDTHNVKCDHILLSIGQTIEKGGLFDGTKVEFNKNGTVIADSVTLQTAEPDVFVGGDLYTGPKFAIDAIAAGKEAAESIHRYVHDGQSLTIARDLREFDQIDTDDIWLRTFDNSSRQEPGKKKGKPETTFNDLRKPLSEKQVQIEASRCLECGMSVVDENRCIGCGLCTTQCEFDAITLERDLPDASRMISAEEKMDHIKPYLVERTKNIVLKKAGLKK